nr:hypothetical protein [Spirochaetaceae bacterium]
MIYYTLAAILGLIFALLGWIYAGKLKRRYGSPFLNFYPLDHPMSPIPHMPSVKKQASRLYKSGVKELLEINLNQDGQLELLKDLSHYRKDLPFPMKKNEKSRYTFDNYFFTAHDAILLYSLLRHLKPKQVIEVGS